MKEVGRARHKFVAIDDAKATKEDVVCKSVGGHFLRKFWVGDGRALAL